MFTQTIIFYFYFKMLWLKIKDISIHTVMTLVSEANPNDGWIKYHLDLRCAD